MDFPFEYVERALQYPSFDHHLVTKEALKEVKPQNAKKYPESEEDELDCDRAYVVDDKERAILEEIRLLERKLKKTVKEDKMGEERRVASSCTSSDTFGNESFIDTSDTDSAIFKNDAERKEMARRKFKIMGQCACTASECDSNPSSATISTSSALTSSEDDVAVPGEEPPLSPSSEETSSSSDEDIDLKDEMGILEKLVAKREALKKEGNKPKVPAKIEEKKKEEDVDKEEESTSSDENSEDVLENRSAEKSSAGNSSEEKSKPKSKTEKSNKSEGVKGPSKEGAGSQSGSATSSSSSSSESLSAPYVTSSDSCIISSSATDDDLDDSGGNMDRFKWDSEDLYATTETDSEFERALDYLDTAMASVNGMFGQTVETNNMSDLEKQKYSAFAERMPTVLKTQRKYEMMEEPVNPHDKHAMTKHFWLVQQIDKGHMFSAKFVSRKNPEHRQLTKGLEKERLLLHELLPELAEPTHIARLVDVGFDVDFKYLILEDLGTDLVSLFEHFGSYFSRATKFLITHFTFRAIRELHSFDLLHMNIRPSAFSVTQNPFNVKITDYSTCLRRAPKMLVPTDLRPDSFSPRIYHQRGLEYDDLVDFESWIFTMIHLCTNHGLPWFQDPTNMLEKKESLLNDPMDFCWDGCCEALPLAAAFIADPTVGYSEFMRRLDLIFSVDVMQFPDEEQPLLWKLDELRKGRRCRPSDTERLLQGDERHWNPADESDSEDGIGYVDHKNRVLGAEEVAAKARMKQKKKVEEPPPSLLNESKTSPSRSPSVPPPRTTPSPRSPPTTSPGSTASPTTGPTSEATEQMSGGEQMTFSESTSLNETKSATGSRSQEESTSAAETSRPELTDRPGKEDDDEEVKVNDVKKKRFLHLDCCDLELKNFRNSSSSSDPKTTSCSFSSWTDSDSDVSVGRNKKKKKKKKTMPWIEKPRDTRSIVDYYDDLDADELVAYNQYEKLKRGVQKEKEMVSSDSDNDLMSDEEDLMKKMKFEVWKESEKEDTPSVKKLKLKEKHRKFLDSFE